MQMSLAIAIYAIGHYSLVRTENQINFNLRFGPNTKPLKFGLKGPLYKKIKRIGPIDFRFSI